MNKFNRELYNRLTTYFKKYRTDFPTSHINMMLIPFVGDFAKMCSNNPNIAALMAMYLTKYLDKNQVRKEILNIPYLRGTDRAVRALIKQIETAFQQKPNLMGVINDIVEVGFRESYNQIDKLNKCPPLKPIGVSNVYFDDVSPELQLAINKHWGDYDGSLSNKFIDKLMENTNNELKSNKLMLKAIVENVQNPITFYLRVKEDKALSDYIKTLPKEMYDEYMDVYNKGYLKYNQNKGLLGDVKTETTADLNYMNAMSSEDKNNIEFIKRSSNIFKDIDPHNDYISPSQLLERCKRIIEQQQVNVDSNTTDQNSPFRKYLYGGLGIGALGLTGYSLYKVYQLQQQRKQLEEEAKRREVEHQRQLEVERKNKRKITINNMVPIPQQSSYSSIWD